MVSSRSGRPHRKDEIIWQCAARLPGRLDPLDRERKAVDRTITPAGMIFEGATGEAEAGSGPNRVGSTLRTIAEAFFEFGRDGKRCRRRDGPAVA